METKGEEVMAEVHYLISDASKQVDVESHVLRYWEDELELDIPRNDMGHRYYTEYHIRLFRQIKELKEKGYQLKAIKSALNKLAGVVEETTITEDYMEEDMKAAWNEGPVRERVGKEGIRREKEVNLQTRKTNQEQRKEVTVGESQRSAVKIGGKESAIAGNLKTTPQAKESREPIKLQTAEAAGTPLKLQTSVSSRAAVKMQTPDPSRTPMKGQGAEIPKSQVTIKGPQISRVPMRAQGEEASEIPIIMQGTQASAVPIKMRNQESAREQAKVHLVENSKEQPELHMEEQGSRPYRHKQGETSFQELDTVSRKEEVSEIDIGKMARLQSVMNHIIGKAMDANMDRLVREVSATVSEDVTDKMIKEVEYLMRVNDEKEEERFRQLDETIRTYQKHGKGRAEAAATKIPFFKKKKFGKSGKKMF